MSLRPSFSRGVFWAVLAGVLAALVIAAGLVMKPPVKPGAG